MITVLPEWYLKAEKKLDDCIDDIIRKNYIDWNFAHDSSSIKKAKGEILGTLVTIKEQVHNPTQPTKEEAEEWGKIIKKAKGGIKKKKRKKIGFDKVKKIKSYAKISLKKERYPQEMESFVRWNIDKTTNKGLIELIWDRFRVKTTLPRLSNYMSLRGIKRKRRRG